MIQKHTMIDLETLGNGNNACIIAIGAYVFAEDDPLCGERFYVTVDPKDCVKHGLVMDAGTVLWWLEQDVAARKAIYAPETPALSLRDALNKFADWYALKAAGTPVWGNGAMFDNIILENAYKTVGLKKPWSYRDDRCYRTLKNLLPQVPYQPMTNSAVAHKADDDAWWQGIHLAQLLQQLKKLEITGDQHG